MNTKDQKILDILQDYKISYIPDEDDNQKYVDRVKGIMQTLDRDNVRKVIGNIRTRNKRKKQIKAEAINKILSLIPKQQSWNEKEIREIVEDGWDNRKLGDGVKEVNERMISQLSQLQPSGMRSKTKEEKHREKEWKKKKFETIDISSGEIIAEGNVDVICRAVGRWSGYKDTKNKYQLIIHKFKESK